MTKQKFGAGDAFLVPNAVGTFYVGQVAEEFPELSSLFCYFFAEPSAEKCPSPEEFGEISKNIVAAALITPELLKRGVWRLCGTKFGVVQHPLLIRARALQADDFVGATVNSAGLVAQFLDTHFGRLPLSHWATPHLALRFLEASAQSRGN